MERIPHKTVRAAVEARREAVAEVDYESGFDTRNGKAYDILLKPGWIGDMYGDRLHTAICYTAAEAVMFIRGAGPCDCDDCKRALEARAPAND